MDFQLRDHLAGRAIEGAAERIRALGVSQPSQRQAVLLEYAEIAYALADAMLVVRMAGEKESKYESHTSEQGRRLEREARQRLGWDPLPQPSEK